jgi:lipoyl(octanoyl) transferase
MVQMEWTYLGRVAYPLALDLQSATARRVAAGAPPRLLLLEHPPTITLGRNANIGNLRLDPVELTRRGFGLHRVPRGGDVTYHGPGQLVGYPIAHLGRAGCSVTKWVQGHARALAASLAHFGIDARWSDVHPGLWVGREKIAALGFQISRQVSTHGFALNLEPDLSHYDTIVPCGLANLGVTSMVRQGVSGSSMARLAALVAHQVAHVFDWELGAALDPDEVFAERKRGVSVPSAI